MSADFGNDEFYEDDEPLSKIERAFAQGEKGITRHHPGRFEIYRGADDQFRWRLKSANGEIVATGESFATKEAAMASIDSIRRVAVDAELMVV